jgi:hypothetical protein
MPNQPPIKMSGALPPPKAPPTARHLNVPGGTAGPSNRHGPQPTKQLKKPSTPDAGIPKPPPSPTLHKPEDDPNEPPRRITSLHPEVSPAIPTISASEADELCSAICNWIWNIDLSRMFDKVVAADQRGQIDDRLYSQLLDFFYCFVPMVTVAPYSDPVIVRVSDLRSHRKILK